MEAEADYKKKSNPYEEMNSKVKDRMPPHIMADFTDHNKQKHLVLVVVLPTGALYYNTTNMDIAVGSRDMTDVVKLLS